MVCGRLSVRLVKIRGHCDILERRMEVKEHKCFNQYTRCQDDTANELAIGGVTSSNCNHLAHQKNSPIP